MATSREERERRRAERRAAERAASESERRRLILGYVVAGLLSLAVLAGVVVVIASGGGGDDGGAEAEAADFPEAAHVSTQSGYIHDAEPDGREGTPPPPVAKADLAAAAKAAGCELRLDLPDEGSTHLNPDDPRPDYGTNPATSGDHDPEQQADGAWRNPVDALYSLHALEHGRIDFQYSPDLPEAEQLELKGVFDEDPSAMLFFPNPEMPYAVATSAWTQLMGCKRYEGAATLDAVRAFRDTYRGRGPEQVPVILPE